MITFYLVITTVLYLAGIVAAVIAAIDINDYGQSEEWKVLRALIGVGAIVIPFWPVVLIGAIPTLVIWGLINAVQLVREERKKAKANDQQT